MPGNGSTTLFVESPDHSAQRVALGFGSNGQARDKIANFSVNFVKFDHYISWTLVAVASPL
jgi:hypothetical protein